MSSPRYAHKRLACLAGCLVLPKLPEIIILTPSTIKKSFMSKNIFEICSAVSFAASICTKEIGFCFEDDVNRLIAHSKPNVRKRACCLARKIILKNSDSGPKLAKLLIEKLKDDDVGVQIAATASIVDCATIYPEMFLEAIPQLYKLLDHKNNWLLIKALVALCALLCAEKRLYSKLGEKILDLMEKTKALSVELEVHKQVVKHFSNVPELINKTKAKIANYIENSDSNIRYTGILVLKNLLKVNKDLLIIYKDKLVKLFVSGDNAIKTRTLEIISENVFLKFS